MYNPHPLKNEVKGSMNKKDKAKAKIQELDTQEKLILCELANIREQRREEINRLNLNEEEKTAWRKRRNSKL